MRRLLGVLGAGLLTAAVLSTVPASAAEQPVSGAELRWGLSAEASNAGAEPGTVNALAAGRIGDTDGDGRIDEPEWTATSGAVRIEQERPDGSSALATWAGLRTTPEGTPLTDPAGGLTAGSVAVLTGGTGTVDPAAGTADVQWDGDLTVVLADGAGLVWLSDLRLEAAGGTARLTADVQAQGSGGTTAAARVTLAETTGLAVAPTATLEPAYAGVGWTAPAGSAAQDTAGSGWGAFPASFLDLVAQAGLADPWYSTGAPDDAAKTPLLVRLVLPVPASPPAGGVEVTDAQFRWGLNQEAGNAAYAPGTVNLFSAGEVPSAGPNVPITEDRWAATAGAVRIEKQQADGSYALATFAGTRTTPTGQPLTTPAAGLSSGHQVVIDGGTGSVDLATGEATVAWDGDFTVALYSGLTFFTVSDPVLTVSGGHGQVTATLGGYAADRDDPTSWAPVPDTPVVLAELSGVALTAAGFTGTPDYLGVGYDPPAGSGAVAQDRSGTSWGSFPRSFVDFQVAVGQGPYWYSSGGPTDRFKPALPLTVSFDAAAPLPPPSSGSPPAAATAGAASNPVVAPPARAPVAVPARPSAAAAAPAPTAEPAALQLLAESGTVRVGGRSPDLASLFSPIAGPRDLGWWASGALLLLAAVLTWLVSTGRLSLRRRNRL